MNNTGFSYGQGRNSGGPDKVDMSLDDIIRLNRKEQKTRKQGPGKQGPGKQGPRKQGLGKQGPGKQGPGKQGLGKQGPGNRKPLLKGWLPQGKGPASRTAGPTQRGTAVMKGGKAAKFGVRGRKLPPPVGRRRGQGVITGLAARKTAAIQKGIGPLNRPPANQKTKPFGQRKGALQRRALEGQSTRPFRQADVQRGPNTAPRRPFQLRRRPLPPVHPTQREARQATFLFRRGLKVHTQVQKPAPAPAPAPQQPAAGRTRQWRTSTNSSGILTVSIDNPTARTQPEPASAWSLHPPAPTPSPPKVEVVEERKPPKGVQLQFDINSVGKPQTKMTLNERFRILKDQRTATSASTSKGSRFVTVG